MSQNASTSTGAPRKNSTYTKPMARNHFLSLLRASPAANPHTSASTAPPSAMAMVNQAPPMRSPTC
jgi:hypothetical protein